MRPRGAAHTVSSTGWLARTAGMIALTAIMPLFAQSPPASSAQPWPSHDLAFLERMPRMS
jgi:hypothetical protein